MNTIPSILNSGLNSADLATTMDNVYEIGKSTAIKLFIISTSGFFFSAYVAHHNWPYATTALGLAQWKQLTLAGTAILTGLGFTAAIMLPGSVKRLKDNVELVAEAERKGSIRSSMLSIETAKRDVAAWQLHNSIRATIFASAFLLGVTAL